MRRSLSRPPRDAPPAQTSSPPTTRSTHQPQSWARREDLPAGVALRVRSVGLAVPPASDHVHGPVPPVAQSPGRPPVPSLTTPPRGPNERVLPPGVAQRTPPAQKFHAYTSFEALPPAQ